MDEQLPVGVFAELSSAVMRHMPRDLPRNFAQRLIEEQPKVKLILDHAFLDAQLEEIRVEIPALPHVPLEVIQEQQRHYHYITGVVEDASPIRPVVMRITSLHRCSEDKLAPEEWQARLAPLKERLLGYAHLDWMRQNHRELAQKLSDCLICFPGTVCTGKEGDICHPAWRSGKYWYTGFQGLRHDINWWHRIAIAE